MTDTMLPIGFEVDEPARLLPAHWRAVREHGEPCADCEGCRHDAALCVWAPTWLVLDSAGNVASRYWSTEAGRLSALDDAHIGATLEHYVGRSSALRIVRTMRGAR